MDASVRGEPNRIVTLVLVTLSAGLAFLAADAWLNFARHAFQHSGWAPLFGVVAVAIALSSPASVPISIWTSRRRAVGTEPAIRRAAWVAAAIALVACLVAVVLRGPI